MNVKHTGNRERILQAAGEMLYRQGYNATSVDHIALVSGVSKSNFYYHFPSKEDLGVAVLAARRDELEAMMDQTLRDSSQSPVDRLARFLEGVMDHQEAKLDHRGCPFGNLVAEMTEHSERIRCFLSGLFSDIAREIGSVIGEGQSAGQFRADVDPNDIGDLILQALQGMQLAVKCERDARPARATPKLLIDLIRA